VNAPAALACPLCHTETGEQVRSAVFGAGFWFNVFVTVLPIALFLSIVALIYYRMPPVGHPSSSVALGREK
jgi:hypothetical protein